MVPEGVATFADRSAVELIACTMTKYRTGAISTGELGQLSFREIRFSKHLVRNGKMRIHLQRVMSLLNHLVIPIIFFLRSEFDTPTSGLSHSKRYWHD
jgi:hypothetical protein